MMFLPTKKRPGYVFLISVLIIGAIAVEMAVSLILLGLAAGQSGLALSQSAQAFEYAQTCAERALRELRSDLSFDGGMHVAFTDGSCSLRHTGGSGNGDRILCIEGRSGNAVRRMEIEIVRVYPRVTISSWKEVTVLTRCP